MTVTKVSVILKSHRETKVTEKEGESLKIERLKVEILQAKAGLTAVQLAEVSGISRQQISTIKTRGTCRPATAAKLAAGLGVKLEEILESEV